MRFCRRFIFVLLMACLAACANGPTAPSSDEVSELGTIRRRFAEIIDAARADPDYEWVHGWGGNENVETDPARYRGYCYHWQELIYEKITPHVKELGWDAAEININRTWFSEHHAVVVFDPEKVARDDLLKPPFAEGWVLDAWQRGEPDVYALEHWLSIPVIVFQPAALE